VDLTAFQQRSEHNEENSMSFIIAIIMGLIIGAIAKFIMPGRDPGGIIVTCLIGIAGSLLATFLGQRLGWYGQGESAGLIGGIVGAVILLTIYRLLIRNRAAR
jgi:uncharacterized membrane protein YeaQ/YmgE (transglycosylase-associated protein family)